MTNNNKNDDITQLRETVRRLVSERVYGMIHESMYEQYLESDSKNASDSDEKTNYGDIKKSDAAKKRKQVTAMLRDPKINMAELGRDLYPDMSDDAARSLISKKSRGVRELTPDEVITLYQKLHNTKGN